jgi:hypothetical protein
VLAGKRRQEAAPSEFTNEIIIIIILVLNMYLFLIIIIIILDAGALFTLVCARFSAVSVDEAMKFIVQTNLI